MYYLVEIEVPDDAVELLQAVLDATEPLGLELRDAALKPPPGQPPLPPGRTQVRAWFDREAAANEAVDAVRAELPAAEPHLTPVPGEDWSQTWKKHVRPVRAGRIWVGPPWELPNAGDAPVKVVIEPGMAFGTGDHPTTALCLEELDRELAARARASVLDVGTGSGVLAIAAARLGATPVVGNDVDPAAVRIARENAEANGTPGIEITDLPVERIRGSFDVVLANLFANVLVQLAPRLAARLAPGGVVLTSGILAPQAEEVVEAFAREGLATTRRLASGEWVLLGFARQP